MATERPQRVRQGYYRTTPQARQVRITSTDRLRARRVLWVRAAAPVRDATSQKVGSTQRRRRSVTCVWRPFSDAVQFAAAWGGQRAVGRKVATTAMT